MKTCFKCRRSLPESEFYKHPRMADGHLGKCKDCAKRDVRVNYAQRRSQYSRYDHNRNQSATRRAMKTVYGRRVDPQKQQARRIIMNAVRDGRAVRLPCEACGDLRSEAHHDDYTQPMKVRWLCFKHHRELEHGQVVTAR